VYDVMMIHKLSHQKVGNCKQDHVSLLLLE
jgi:hypothetical protein